MWLVDGMGRMLLGAWIWEQGGGFASYDAKMPGIPKGFASYDAKMLGIHKGFGFSSKLLKKLG